MEINKKPKRPRIGESQDISTDTGHFEKVTYNPNAPYTAAETAGQSKGISENTTDARNDYRNNYNQNNYGNRGNYNNNYRNNRQQRKIGENNYIQHDLSE